MTLIQLAEVNLDGLYQVAMQTLYLHLVEALQDYSPFLNCCRRFADEG